MKQKKNLAIVYGGDSSEWEISVLSGQNVASHINRDKYNVYEILMRYSDWRVVNTADGCAPEEPVAQMEERIAQMEERIAQTEEPLAQTEEPLAQMEELVAQIDKSDFSFIQNGEKVQFDVVLVMIHGTPGEDGIIQAYFESLHIPCTSSNSAVSVLAFDKYACKCALRSAGIPMAKDLVLKQDEEVDEKGVIDALGLPLFIKPNGGGSSFGAAKVMEAEELKPALCEAFRECSTVLAEAYIAGRELTNGILKTATQTILLPVTEIVSKNAFFDYQAKYQGASSEITPAPISDALSAHIQHLTSTIFDHLGCKGFIRVDYIAKGEEVFFLEVNTIPGMTQMSLVPQQVAAAGMSMSAFLDLIIENCYVVS